MSQILIKFIVLFSLNEESGVENNHKKLLYYCEKKLGPKYNI